MNYKNNHIFFLLFLITVFFTGCIHKHHSEVRIVLHITGAYHKYVYLKTIPFSGEKEKIIDSSYTDRSPETIQFNIEDSAERPYQLSFTDIINRVVFVNDSPFIEIDFNYYTKKYSVKYSKASTSLKNFEDSQGAIAGETQRIFAYMKETEKKQGHSSAVTDSLNKLLNAKMDLLNEQYKNYADTVSSPAAFMFIYNNIDFGNNFTGLKKFILHASARFPAYSAIQKLKNETLDYISIFEQEFKIGDSLPSITLPDRYGQSFSTASLKGKFYLMDFWSTWCDQCKHYLDEDKKARQIFPKSEIEFVSVAVDNRKRAWEQIISNNMYDWIQLLDEQMWQGIAVKTLKFDSIPFNILVSPDGRVARKAIPPDSLIQVLSKELHN